VSDPEIVNHLRFSSVAVVPLTGTLGLGARYPVVESGPSGLRERSSAPVDQVARSTSDARAGSSDR
jgi:hypothetical protein